MEDAKRQKVMIMLLVGAAVATAAVFYVNSRPTNEATTSNQQTVGRRVREKKAPKKVEKRQRQRSEKKQATSTKRVREQKERQAPRKRERQRSAPKKKKKKILPMATRWIDSCDQHAAYFGPPEFVPPTIA